MKKQSIDIHKIEQDAKITKKSLMKIIKKEGAFATKTKSIQGLIDLCNLVLNLCSEIKKIGEAKK